MEDDIFKDRRRSLATLAQICVTQLIKHMDDRWGTSRLPMLVSPELRARFLKQQRLWGEAMLSEVTDAIVAQSHGMLKAWYALDEEAIQLGQTPLPWSAWQIVAPTGEIVTFIRDERDLPLVPKQSGMEVYTADSMADLVINLKPVERKEVRKWPNGATSPIDWEEGDDIPF